LESDHGDRKSRCLQLFRVEVAIYDTINSVFKIGGHCGNKHVDGYEHTDKIHRGNDRHGRNDPSTNSESSTQGHLEAIRWPPRE
jgi:hypothetical protein